MAYTRRSGVRLHYRDAGSGSAVLLHTGGGGDGRMWDLAGYTAALAGYRTLVLDHRGHGGSDCPPGVPAHRLGEYADDVIAVLDAAGVSTSALVGYSAGARIAYAAARAYPRRISAVAGIGAVGAPGDDNSDGAEWAAQVRASGMRAAMEEITAEEPEPTPGWLLDNLASTQAEMFALMLEAWASEPAVWSDLPHVQCPALVICGENEEPAAARNARLAAAAMPHGTAVVLPGLWHLQAFWRTDQTLPPLTSFLRQHLGSSQQTAS
jgi:pimeloyl-ACP methyl ester carboxylesterase